MRRSAHGLECSVLLALLGACSGAATPSRDGPPAGSYFPADTLFFAPLYEAHLRAMAEPPMSAVAVRATQAFRFTWLRTFDRPVAIRVEKRAEGAIVEAVVLSGLGGYEPGSVAERVVRDLTPVEWGSVEHAVAKADVWDLGPETDLGLDGSWWLLEGVRGGRYGCVERWTPQPDSHGAAFRGLCLSLVDLSGLTITPVY